MTIAEFEKIVDFYSELSSKDYYVRKNFLNMAWDLCKQCDNAEQSTSMLDKLFSVIDRNEACFWLLQRQGEINEENLAALIALLPVGCCGELIHIADENMKAAASGAGVKPNNLLLFFITNSTRENVIDYDQKVKVIIAFNNQTSIQQAKESAQKDAEIQRLRLLINSQVDAAQVLEAVKKPLTEFESFVSVSVQRKTYRYQRLVEIASSFRKVIKELYGIETVVDVAMWKKQSAIEYDPSIHNLVEPVNADNQKVVITLDSLGFSLINEDGTETLIPARVRLWIDDAKLEKNKQTKPKGKPQDSNSKAKETE